jgi:class 3 adenylate cyclase
MTGIRRLAAILAADVAGYSRLIGGDEEGTLNRLRSLRVELVDPTIAEHRAASSKQPVMVWWSNFPVWSMHCVVRPNGST